MDKTFNYFHYQHHHQTLNISSSSFHLQVRMANVTLPLQELTYQKPVHFHGSQDQFHVVNSFHSDVGFSQMFDPKYQQEQSFPNYYGLLDDLYNPIDEEVISNGESQSAAELDRENQGPFTLSSLQLLQNYGAGSKKLNGAAVDHHFPPKIRELSTEDVFRVAGAKFIQSSSQIGDMACDASHPFGLYFSGLSDEEARDVELAELLLAAAERVGDGQHERARRLLNQLDRLSSRTGNPVQRLVHHFSDSLRDKIDGRKFPEFSGKRQARVIEEAIMGPTPTMLACHEETPFSQVFQFPAVQAVAESVGDARRVHVVDLAIRSGVQWTVLMQALVARGGECPVEMLTVTAVGTTERRVIEETGRRLASFAESMSLPFCFKVVMVSDMMDLKEDRFEIREDQAVVVYAQLVLRTMIVQPSQLDHLMTVIRNINPRIMVLHEVESNHNSPVFADRFIEALFFFGAYFDCLEACMPVRDNPNRAMTESFFRDGIRNIVAAEGEERSVRSVKIGVWRAFLGRFGMAEAELSRSSLYQANLMLKQFSCGSSCTLDMNGKSLIIGWKGTPIHSLSIWKFL